MNEVNIMKKVKLFLPILAIALLLSGCSLVHKDNKCACGEAEENQIKTKV